VPVVTGKLHVLRNGDVLGNGGEVTPAGGVPPIKPITTWGSANRNDDNDTLNMKSFLCLPPR
jgi:hypothetical protein